MWRASLTQHTRERVQSSPFSNFVSIQKCLKGLIHTGSNGISTDFGVEHRGDVFAAAVDAFNELEEANRFGHFLGERMRHFGWYTVNFLTDGAVDVISNEVIDMLDGDQSTDFMISKPDLGVSQKLLGQLDDCTVRPTDVTAGTTLSSQPRDNVNHEIDLIGQHRIKGNERLTRELGQSDIGRKVGICQKASAFESSRRALAPGFGDLQNQPGLTPRPDRCRAIALGSRV